ncbi:signal peptidase I, partial [Mycolicibacterium sp. CBMA 361]|nr:signal peptidase I [Mycolicibacterium sp. CBMA 361]
MTGPSEEEKQTPDSDTSDDTDTAVAAGEQDTADEADKAGQADEKPRSKLAALREGVVLVVTAVLLYYLVLTFVARPYLIPSESMEPTLHGCTGCVGDRIMVDKMTFRFSKPEPGDVVVFKGPPNWNISYQSI